MSKTASKPTIQPLCIAVLLPIDRQGGSLAAALRWTEWANESDEFGASVVLRVGFLDGEQAWWDTVRQHAVTWSAYAGVTFRFSDQAGFDPATGDIRISFTQPENWSFIGCQAQQIEAPRPTMNLGSVADPGQVGAYRRIVLHEFGHALGLVHEHRTPNYHWTDEQGVEHAGIPWDVDAVNTYYADTYGWDAETTYQQVIAPYSGDELTGDTFDRDSIMIYAVPAELTGGRFAVGWNEELSAGDKAFIAALYPQPATGG